jgi:DNA end-binding protein Ku
VGVGTIVLRQREHLAALEPSGEALVLTTMRFAHEIRSARPLDLPRAKHGYQASEMKLARQLIDTLSAKWDPTEFEDTYTDVLRRIIARKVEGEEVTVPEVPERPKIADLAKALRESLAHGRRPPAKMDPRRVARTRRSGTRHRKAA